MNVLGCETSKVVKKNTNSYQIKGIKEAPGSGIRQKICPDCQDLTACTIYPEVPRGRGITSWN